MQKFPPQAVIEICHRQLLGPWAALRPILQWALFLGALVWPCPSTSKIVPTSTLWWHKIFCSVTSMGKLYWTPMLERIKMPVTRLGKWLVYFRSSCSNPYFKCAQMDKTLKRKILTNIVILEKFTKKLQCNFPAFFTT